MAGGPEGGASRAEVDVDGDHDQAHPDAGDGDGTEPQDADNEKAAGPLEAGGADETVEVGTDTAAGADATRRTVDEAHLTTGSAEQPAERTDEDAPEEPPVPMSVTPADPPDRPDPRDRAVEPADDDITRVDIPPAEPARVEDDPTELVTAQSPPPVGAGPRFTPPPYDPPSDAPYGAASDLPDDPPDDPPDDSPGEPPAYEAQPPVPQQQYATGAVPILEIEGGWEAVYRRRRRQTLTFLGGLAAVMVLGFFAWLTYAGVVPWPFGGTVSVAQNVCTRSKPLAPKSIAVRVFNGSSREGLAGQVSGQLKSLGFAVKATGNDPLESKIRGAVEIRHGENGDLAAATMTAYVVGKVSEVQDDRQDGMVDLVLGPSYSRLHTKGELKKSLAAVTSTLPLTCPVGVTPPSTPTPTPAASRTSKAKATPRPTKS
jgi:hypothetical protein